MFSSSLRLESETDVIFNKVLAIAPKADVAIAIPMMIAMMLHPPDAVNQPSIEVRISIHYIKPMLSELD